MLHLKLNSTAVIGATTNWLQLKKKFLMIIDLLKIFWINCFVCKMTENSEKSQILRNQTN